MSSGVSLFLSENMFIIHLPYIYLCLVYMVFDYVVKYLMFDWCVWQVVHGIILLCMSSILFEVNVD